MGLGSLLDYFKFLSISVSLVVAGLVTAAMVACITLTNFQGKSLLEPPQYLQMNLKLKVEKLSKLPQLGCP